MQQTVVPHLGHFPFIIVVPLEVCDSFASFISTFPLHLTQYPCVILFPPLTFSVIGRKLAFIKISIEGFYLKGVKLKLNLSSSVFCTTGKAVE